MIGHVIRKIIKENLDRKKNSHQVALGNIINILRPILTKETTNKIIVMSKRTHCRDVILHREIKTRIGNSVVSIAQNLTTILDLMREGS